MYQLALVVIMLYRKPKGYLSNVMLTFIVIYLIYKLFKFLVDHKN